MANKELTKHKQLECLCTMNYWVNQRTIRYTKIKLFNKVDYRILDFECDCQEKSDPRARKILIHRCQENSDPFEGKRWENTDPPYGLFVF